MKKVFALSMILAACATPTPLTVVQTAAPMLQTVVVTQVVPGATQVVQVETTKEVVITATPAPEAQQLLVFNWWTGPGEREAADAMYKAFSDKYPDIKIVNNPVPGGGGVNMRVVLQARLTAGLPPDSWQTLGGALPYTRITSGMMTSSNGMR